MRFWKTWVQDNHECNEDCNGLKGHFGQSSYRTIIHLENRIQLEFGHLTIYWNKFKDGFFCLNCSLFNPKILFYEIQERWRETVSNKSSGEKK